MCNDTQAPKKEDYKGYAHEISQTVAIFAFLYASKTWALDKKKEQKVQGAMK